MIKYFEEKSQQVSPGSLKAFVIDICSRYGKADEVIEMINLSKLAAQSDVAHYVKSVFYDSKANLCTFEFVESVKVDDPVATALKQAALESIAQFDWFGFVDHGAPLDDMFA